MSNISQKYVKGKQPASRIEYNGPIFKKSFHFYKNETFRSLM